MDDATLVLISAVRPMLKSHLRRTRELLAYLTQLDETLDAQSQEAQREPAKENRRAA